MSLSAFYPEIYFNRLWNRFSEVVFGSEKAYQNEILTELIEQNHQLGGAKEGFLYAGKFYTLQNPKNIHPTLRKPLHPSLYPQAMEYIKVRELADKERQRILHGLSILLTNCKTYQDARDALPDSLKDCLPEISKLPRTRPEAWTLADKPLLLRQYQETKELIEFYQANKLLY